MLEPSETTPADLDEICARHIGRPGALLPILHDVHHRFGHISREAVAGIAANLNLTRAEVDGVVSFYADFKAEPTTGRRIRVCRAEACQASGGREVWNAAVSAAEASDGRVEVEAVYCLGNCACGPSAELDGRTLGRVDVDRVSALIRDLSGETRA